MATIPQAGLVGRWRHGPPAGRETFRCCGGLTVGMDSLGIIQLRLLRRYTAFDVECIVDGSRSLDILRHVWYIESKTSGKTTHPEVIDYPTGSSFQSVDQCKSPILRITISISFYLDFVATDDITMLRDVDIMDTAHIDLRTYET